MFGRRCYAPITTETNFHVKSFLERASINAPIQGTACDIIKKAMIAVNYYLQKNNLQTKILLQIHDELIFEAPDAEVDLVLTNIKPIIEGIGKQINLHLIADIEAGDNWLKI